MIESRAAEADQLRWKAVESARYEAELARRRYMRVDPDNRLVVHVLKVEWNGKLRAVAKAEERYEQQSKLRTALPGKAHLAFKAVGVRPSSRAASLPPDPDPEPEPDLFGESSNVVENA